MRARDTLPGFFHRSPTWKRAFIPQRDGALEPGSGKDDRSGNPVQSEHLSGPRAQLITSLYLQGEQNYTEQCPSEGDTFRWQRQYAQGRFSTWCYIGPCHALQVLSVLFICSMEIEVVVLAVPEWRATSPHTHTKSPPERLTINVSSHFKPDSDLSVHPF